MAAAGARGQTSVFPADISDGGAPASSPAVSLMGEHCSRTRTFELL